MSGKIDKKYSHWVINTNTFLQEIRFGKSFPIWKIAGWKLEELASWTVLRNNLNISLS